MDADHLLARIEWEPLRAAQEWRLIDACPQLPPGTDTVTVKRDESYHLDVALSGATASKNADALRTSLDGGYTPGELVRGPDATFQTMGGAVKIDGYLVKSYSFEHHDLERVE